MIGTYQGACHCGQVQFSATLDLDDCMICDCSICRMKGTIIVRVEDTDFKLTSPVDDLGLYTFNKHLAKHYFCRTCGIHPFHRPRTAPDMWGVNARCLKNTNIFDLNPRLVHGSKLD